MPADFSRSLVPKRVWGNFWNLPFFQVDFMPKMIVQMLMVLPFADNTGMNSVEKLQLYTELDSEREEL